MIAKTKEQSGITCTINTTEDCNLRCKYCYEINKRNRSIDLETCKKFIDIIIEDDDPVLSDTGSKKYREGLILDFIGGDSLVDVMTLDKIIKYLIFKLNTSKSRNAEFWRNKYRLSLSTNGTLFVRPEVREFCERYKNILSVTVSIDGCPAIHDFNRIFPDGSPSLPVIMQTWDWYKATFPYNANTTKSTCSKASIPYLYDSLVFMHERLGIRYINQNFIMEDTGCTDTDYAMFREQMQKCIDYVSVHRDDLYWSMIAKESFAQHRLSAGNDWALRGHCGSGGMPALSIDGKIYPCFRWLPHTQQDNSRRFVCGDASHGLIHKEVFREVREGAYRCNCTKDDKCRTCEYESACAYCIGGCYAEFGEFRRTTHICEIIKIQCEFAEKYWSMIGKEEQK